MDTKESSLSHSSSGGGKRVPGGILRPSSYTNLQNAMNNYDPLSPTNSPSAAARKKSSPRRSSSAGASSPSANGTSSSTILSHQTLGHVSTERFYTLSELQHHAPRVMFLQNVMVENRKLRLDPNYKPKREFSSYSILYILWRPEMTLDPLVFVDNVLWRSIRAIQSRTSIAMSVDHIVSSPKFSSAGGSTPTAAAASRVSFQTQSLDSPAEEMNTVPAEEKNTATTDGQENNDNGKIENDENEDFSDEVDGHDEMVFDAHEESNAAGEEQQPRKEGDGGSKKRMPKKKKVGSSKKRSSTSLYIVVDRVALPTSKRNLHLSPEELHQQQEALAEQTVRHAAIRLRDLCEGISVFCANHERAAPGLEACMNAVAFGAADRRRHVESMASSQSSSSSSEPTPTNAYMVSGDDLEEMDKKMEEEAALKAAKNSNNSLTCGNDEKPVEDGISYLGMVALAADDFLGLQSQKETDAAQNVMQSCWCAEWNGRGNLASFAKRAHAQWRLDRGLTVDGLLLNDIRKKTVPRRRRFEYADEQALDQAIQQYLLDTFMLGMILFYLTFHYGHDIQSFFMEWWTGNREQ